MLISFIRFLKYIFVLNMVIGSGKVSRDINGNYLRIVVFKLLIFEELS